MRETEKKEKQRIIITTTTTSRHEPKNPKYERQTILLVQHIVQWNVKLLIATHTGGKYELSYTDGTNENLKQHQTEYFDERKYIERVGAEWASASS